MNRMKKKSGVDKKRFDYSTSKKLLQTHGVQPHKCKGTLGLVRSNSLIKTVKRINAQRPT